MKILRKLKEKEKQKRILVLGLDDAGKTTFVGRLCGKSAGELQQIGPTVGFEIVTLVSSLSGWTLNIWDIGGQKSLRSFWRNYFEETDALFWVVDSTAPERLELCWQELARVLQVEKLSGVPLLLVANKSDLPTSRPITPLPSFLSPDTPILVSGNHLTDTSSSLMQIEAFLSSLPTTS